MKNFIKFIRHFFLFKNLIDEQSWYLQDSNFIALIKNAFNYYSHNLKYGKELPDLLSQNESLRRDVEYYKVSSNEKYETIESQKEELRQLSHFHFEEKKRFELEVIHLKELVQEKNMVIDKLIKDKKSTKKQTKNDHIS